MAVQNIRDKPVVDEILRKKAAKKKKDFYDIISGGFVNVQTGDILIDKNSLARGMSGSPGTALPFLTGAVGDGGGGGIGKQINDNRHRV